MTTGAAVVLAATTTAVGAAITWLIARSRWIGCFTELSHATRRAEKAEATVVELTQYRDQAIRLAAERDACREAERRRDEDEQRFRAIFDDLAGRALRSNTEQLIFRSQNQFDQFRRSLGEDLQSGRSEIDGIMRPLRDRLSAFEQEIAELERRRSGAYAGLVERVEGMARAYGELRGAADELRSALTSSGSARGRWGEMQLRRAVEIAGLAEHVDFDVQPAGEEGGRPDMLIRLPGNVSIPVDAKAPAPPSFVEGPEAEERRRKFVQRLRAHVKELASRDYRSQFAVAPRFVVLYLPYESALQSALAVDPNLLEGAARRHVLIWGPTALVAGLHAVAFTWSQAEPNERAVQVLQLARDLLERLSVFSQRYERVGTAMSGAVEAYNRSLGSWNGRLLPVLRRIAQWEPATDAPQELKEADDAIGGVRSDLPPAPEATGKEHGGEE